MGAGRACLAPGHRKLSARVQSWWDIPARQPRHTGESRYPGILAVLELYVPLALLDSGLRRKNAFHAIVIISELLQLSLEICACPRTDEKE